MPFSAEFKSTIAAPSADPQPINDSRERSQEDPRAQPAGAPHPGIHMRHETPIPTSDAIKNVLTACWDEGVRNDTTGLPLSLRPGDKVHAQVELSRDRQQERPDTSSVVQPAQAEGIKSDTSDLLLDTGDQAEICQRQVPEETR